MDKAPEDIILAIEMIRQLENLNYSAETIIQAMIHVCKDTLNKLPEDSYNKHWKQIIIRSFMERPKD